MCFFRLAFKIFSFLASLDSFDVSYKNILELLWKVNWWWFNLSLMLFNDFVQLPLVVQKTSHLWSEWMNNLMPYWLWKQESLSCAHWNMINPTMLLIVINCFSMLDGPSPNRHTVFAILFKLLYVYSIIASAN